MLVHLVNNDFWDNLHSIDIIARVIQSDSIWRIYKQTQMMQFDCLIIALHTIPFHMCGVHYRRFYTYKMLSIFNISILYIHSYAFVCCTTLRLFRKRYLLGKCKTSKENVKRRQILKDKNKITPQESLDVVMHCPKLYTYCIFIVNCKDLVGYNI